MTTPTKLSAKALRVPLLKTLATLSNFTAETPITFKSTYDPVCKGLGTTLEAHGKDNRGKFWVANWMLGAFRSLKKAGLAKQLGRGKWGLTEKGIKEAGPAPLTPTPAPAPPVIGVSFPIGPGNDASNYHADPYIRALAAQQTKCYGHFTYRSTVCQACTLSGACRNLVSAELSALAVKLEAQDKLEAEKAAQAAATPTPPPPKPQPPKPQPDGTWDNSGVEDIISYMDTDCYRCGEPIAKDDPCFWKRPDDDNAGGLFHYACE